MNIALPETLQADSISEDPILACLTFLAEHFEQPSSQLLSRSGLPVDERGFLPFHQVEAALELVNLQSDPVSRKIGRWKPEHLPAILRANDGNAFVLLDVKEDDALLFRPGQSEARWEKRADLAGEYTGEAVQVIPDSTQIRQDERPWDIARKHHWFWQEMWKVRRSFMQVAGAALFINLLGFALPLFTMNVYDRVIPNKAVSSLWVLAAGVLLAFAFEFALRLARAKLVDETGRTMDARLSQKLFEKIMNLPLAERSGSTGAMVRRVSEYEIVRDFFASTTVVLVIDLVFLFLFVALIALLAGWLAMVPLVMIVVMVAAGYFLQRRMGVAATEAQADSSLQHSMLVESISGMETLKACAAEGRMLGRWRTFAQMSADTQQKMRQLSAAAINLASLCQQMTSISLIIGGFYLFNAGIISMGAIIAIVMLGGRSLAPVGQLAFLMTRGRQAFLTLNSIQTLMERPDERSLGGKSVIPVVREGHINFEDVSFQYPDTELDALSNLSFEIKPGERVAIIGRVASGKSTLGRIMCGLYAPTSGSLMVDGLDNRQYQPRDLRTALRFVGQDSELFSGTIKNNLELGTLNCDDEQMLEALRKSGADSFLSRDAAGFDRVTGERGSRLSGGQRSFLVLARALMGASKLLYLDEPTGAMDVHTEKQFIARLDSAIGRDQTLVISTHRHAILSIVDRIIVMDQGRIAADGARDDILKNIGKQDAGK